MAGEASELRGAGASRIRRESDRGRGDAEDARKQDDRPHESEAERLDRNEIELLNELRVAGTGIQVLLAFLLVAPFDSRFAKLTGAERGVYYVTLVSITVAAVLLIAPSIHHRLLFRLKMKEYLVQTASRLLIVAMGFLATGLTGITVLITALIFGSVPAVFAGVVAAGVIVGLWFAVPLRRAEHVRRHRHMRAGATGSQLRFRRP